MCTEYSTEIKCENKDKCKLQAILTENARLKAENKELKRRIRKMGNKGELGEVP